MMTTDASSHPPIIRIAAGLIVDKAGQSLLVRKRGTHLFMQAGGKIEPGETPLAALARELNEELGLALGAGPHEYLGRFTADAANEAGHIVEAEVFYIEASAPVMPAAEIDAAVWIDPFDIADLLLAPLTRDCLMPIAQARVATSLSRGGGSRSPLI